MLARSEVGLYIRPEQHASVDNFVSGAHENGSLPPTQRDSWVTDDSCNGLQHNDLHVNLEDIDSDERSDDNASSKNSQNSTPKKSPRMLLTDDIRSLSARPNASPVPDNNGLEEVPADPWSDLLCLTPEEELKLAAAESVEAEDDEMIEVETSFRPLSSARESVCSERSSRLDSQTYQNYTAGILHSSDKSKKFQELQKHYTLLDKITQIEELTSTPFSKLQQQIPVNNIDTKEVLDYLKKELEQSRKEKELPKRPTSYYDTWQPDHDRGLLRKEKSLGDLKAIFNRLESIGQVQDTNCKHRVARSRSFKDLSNKNSDSIPNDYESFRRNFSPKANSPAVCKPSQTKPLTFTRNSSVEEEYKQNKLNNKSPKSGTKNNVSPYAVPSKSPRKNSESASPRRMERALYGTLINETPANEYEIYVEEKRKAFKGANESSGLHVRCMSAPYSQDKLTLSGDKASESTVDEPQTTYTAVPARPYKYKPLPPTPQQSSLSVGSGVPLDHLKTNYRYLSNNITNQENENIETQEADTSNEERIYYDTPRTFIRSSESIMQNHPNKIEFQSDLMSTSLANNIQQMPNGYDRDVTPVPSLDGHILVQDGIVACATPVIVIPEKPLTPSYNTNTKPPAVNFKVRDLRNLAKDNEFSQSKFAQRKPILEKYLQDVLTHAGRNESPPGYETHGDVQGDTYGLYVHTDWNYESSPDIEYRGAAVPDTWINRGDEANDVDYEDSISSKTSSTGTFIIKTGEEDGDADQESLCEILQNPLNQINTDSDISDLLHRPKSPTFPADSSVKDNYTRTQSETDLNVSSVGAQLPPRPYKSHSNVNFKMVSSPGVIRPIAGGNLREMFRKQKDKTKFSTSWKKSSESEPFKQKNIPQSFQHSSECSNYQSLNSYSLNDNDEHLAPALPPREYEDPASNFKEISPAVPDYPLTDTVKYRTDQYDAYNPPNDIRKVVEQDVNLYKREVPIAKPRNPSDLGKLTVNYFDVLGNEWAREKSKKSPTMPKLSSQSFPSGQHQNQNNPHATNVSNKIDSLRRSKGHNSIPQGYRSLTLPKPILPKNPVYYHTVGVPKRKPGSRSVPETLDRSNRQEESGGNESTTNSGY